eukprot:3004872-Lingulodinium_polyedra.AAC.1
MPPIVPVVARALPSALGTPLTGPVPMPAAGGAEATLLVDAAVGAPWMATTYLQLRAAFDVQGVHSGATA